MPSGSPTASYGAVRQGLEAQIGKDRDFGKTDVELKNGKNVSPASLDGVPIIKSGERVH